MTEPTYTIQIGEHGILGAGAHLTVAFIDDGGNKIVEINGLATNPRTGDTLPVGAAIFGHDIRGYITGPEPYYFEARRTRSEDILDTKPISELKNDLRIIEAVIQEINDKNISYQVLNTNSNSVAMTTLRALGYSVEQVQAISTRLTPGINIELLSDEEIAEIVGSTGSGTTDECFLADTSIRMWPLDPSIKPRLDGSYDEELVLSKVWHKPISEIAVGDIIVAYDKQGRLQPDRVTRTMQNNATHILDFWGTGITAGHACYCADGPFKGEHAPIMDILRTDTAMMRTDGTMFRAATSCEVGSIGDRMVYAEASVQKPDGSWTPKKLGQIRFGTRISTPDGKKSVSVMEIAERKGWSLSDDGYMIGKIEGEDGTLEESKFPFPYTDSAELPKPEDYILTRSQVTLEDIYKAGEWEQIGTRMPAPASMVGFNPNTTSTMLQPSKPKPNLPPAFANRSDVPASLSKAQRPAQAAAAPSMNRKQRKAMEAKQRKAAKARRRLAS